MDGTPDLSGHPSHGLTRLPEYVDHVLAGRWHAATRPEVVMETDVISIDCGFGFGHLAAELMTTMTGKKALSVSVSVGGVVNDTHAGRLGEWTEMAVELVCSSLSAAADSLGP